MKLHEHLLVVLAEECAETAQRASKALRFGLNEVEPGQFLSNTERLRQEMCDICALWSMLAAHGCVPSLGDKHSYDLVETKKHQMVKFLDYSKQLGTLEAY